MIVSDSSETKKKVEVTETELEIARLLIEFVLELLKEEKEEEPGD